MNLSSLSAGQNRFLRTQKNEVRVTNFTCGYILRQIQSRDVKFF